MHNTPVTRLQTSNTSQRIRILGAHNKHCKTMICLHEPMPPRLLKNQDDGDSRTYVPKKARGFQFCFTVHTCAPWDYGDDKL